MFESTFAVNAVATIEDGMLVVRSPLPTPDNVAVSEKTGKPFTSLRVDGSKARFAVNGKPFHLPASFTIGYLSLVPGTPGSKAQDAQPTKVRKMFDFGTDAK